MTHLETELGIIKKNVFIQAITKHQLIDEGGHLLVNPLHNVKLVGTYHVLILMINFM